MKARVNVSGHGPFLVLPAWGRLRVWFAFRLRSLACRISPDGHDFRYAGRDAHGQRIYCPMCRQQEYEPNSVPTDIYPPLVVLTIPGR